MAEFHEFGKAAESFAAQYLIAKGYCILHTNWTYGHKELDIVCTNGRELVVVEVKARKQSDFPPPEDLISHKKEQFIIEASEHYLYQYRVSLPVRFDLIAIIKSGALMDIQHIEDAIIPAVN